MHAALLLNGDDLIERWQYDALTEAIRAGLTIDVVAHCENTPSRSISIKTLPYYALAWFTYKGVRSTNLIPATDLIPPQALRVRFRGVNEGAWQRIPAEVAEQFRDLDVIVKFGMSLMRGADSIPVTYGVLSYHHGDPTRYRGRPASFYEMLEGSATQGVIVQQLSETLDGGRILAQGTSRVVPWSYRKTIKSAHRVGVPLLTQALRALSGGRRGWQPEHLGKNYKIPAAKVVWRFLARLALAKLLRAYYGAFVEKKWNVGTTSLELTIHNHGQIDISSIREIAAPRKFAFAADPSWCPDGSVVCELMDSTTGQGVIGRWADGKWDTTFVPLPGHASYPHVVREGGNVYLLPEVASFSAPLLVEITDKQVGEITCLRGLETARLIDATLWHHDNTWFLFGGFPGNADQELHLWHSTSLFGPYELHPESPVCLDVRGARMAGPLQKIAGQLYRPGQDCSVRYGGHIRLHRVRNLSPTAYVEEAVGTVAVSGAFGPHTIHVRGDQVLLDYYVERRTLLAGYRRAAALLRSIRTARVGVRPLPASLEVGAAKRAEFNSPQD